MIDLDQWQPSRYSIQKIFRKFVCIFQYVFPVQFEYEGIHPLQRPSSIEPPRPKSSESTKTDAYTTTQNSHMSEFTTKSTYGLKFSKWVYQAHSTPWGVNWFFIGLPLILVLWYLDPWCSRMRVLIPPNPFSGAGSIHRKRWPFCEFRKWPAETFILRMRHKECSTR